MKDVVPVLLFIIWLTGYSHTLIFLTKNKPDDDWHFTKSNFWFIYWTVLIMKNFYYNRLPKRRGNDA